MRKGILSDNLLSVSSSFGSGTLGSCSSYLYIGVFGSGTRGCSLVAKVRLAGAQLAFEPLERRATVLNIPCLILWDLRYSCHRSWTTLWKTEMDHPFHLQSDVYAFQRELKKGEKSLYKRLLSIAEDAEFIDSLNSFVSRLDKIHLICLKEVFPISYFS